ncbi:ABC transporter substrate-binding protein, partial [bacterium]|nr:ABC transporter substrate-binding protein [bacterium]
MKFRTAYFSLVIVVFFCLTGCQNDSENQNHSQQTVVDNQEIKVIVTPEKEREYAILDDNIQWLTNILDPVFSSDQAEKGGVLHSAITSFPMTFRVVGPDSNGS